MAGAVFFTSGKINANPSVSLNFDTNVFQWNGGQLAGHANNVGQLVLTGASDDSVSGQLYTAGLIWHTGTGRLQFDNGPSRTVMGAQSGEGESHAFAAFWPGAITPSGGRAGLRGTRFFALKIALIINCLPRG